MQLKLDSKVGAAAQAALDPHIPLLYAQPGRRIMAIIEMAHVERVQPAPDSDKTASVRMRISHLEVPSQEQEGFVREAQRALFLQRTASGTFSEDGQLELSQDTLRLAAGMLHGIEVARLRAALTYWVGYAERVVNGPDLTVSETKHELDQIASGLAAVLERSPDDEDA